MKTVMVFALVAAAAILIAVTIDLWCLPILKTCVAIIR